MGYVVGDFDHAVREAQESSACEKNYELPDGRKILVGAERFKCAETLFKPSLAGHDGMDGVHTYCNNSVQSCEEAIRADLYANIVLSGGSTLFEGMAERMWREMYALNPKENKVAVLGPPERLYSVWLGGSILASMTSF
jgi:actin